MINAINNSGLRAAEIVNTMLSFARKSNANDMSSHYSKKLMDEILELAATDYDLKKRPIQPGLNQILQVTKITRKKF
nr:hypothetical protein [uncultured Desulfobacter sp.]